MVNFTAPVVQVVHFVPGRIRLRIPALKIHPELADRILTAGMAHPGVHRIRVNLVCASVVIEGDRNVVATSSPSALIHHWLATHSGEQRSGKATPSSKRGGHLSLGLSLASAALTFFGGGWIKGVALALMACGALPIIRRGLITLAGERRLTVDHLDSTAVGLMAYLGDVRGAALMCALVHLGEEIRERTARRSQQAAFDLQAALGRRAWLVRGREKVSVKIDQLQVNDTVVVYPGDLIPVDGVVVNGMATVDQKMLTGEFAPVLKMAGERVLAGTTVADGKLYVRAEAVGESTRAGWIVRMLKEAPILDTRAASYAHRFGDRLVAPTFAVAGVSLAATGSIARAAAILIVDFATGIRVSAPTSVMATLARAARDGVLIKGGRALENLAAADVIVFDKTGTLTRGEPEVSDVIGLDRRFPADDVLALAAAAEMRLRHPSARAVVCHAERRQIPIPRRDDLRYTPGMGVVATVEGDEVRVGSARFMGEIGLSVDRLNGVVSRLRNRGSSFVYVAVNGTLAGLLAYQDPVRPEGPAVIKHLQDRGIREILMVTGDEPATARTVARRLGICRVHASVLPDEKAAIVRSLQREGHVVAVVGDGINDSPALSRADVSISMAHGADVARETADVLLTDSDLWGLIQAIDLARQSVELIRQNLVIVGVPNVAALALAAVGRLSPVGSTLLNNGSTVVAALNSLRPIMPVDGHQRREPPASAKEVA